MRYRNEVKDSLKDRGISMTLMPFFIKAASRALEQFPELNAWLDEEKQSLQILDNHNIGIAMDTPDGLVVPNIRNVQNLNVYAIAKELNRLQELGKRTSLSPGDLTDTTFSLSNIGIVSTKAEPVMNEPINYSTDRSIVKPCCVDLDRWDVYEAGNSTTPSDNRCVRKSTQGTAVRRRRECGTDEHDVCQLVGRSSRSRRRNGGQVFQSVEALCRKSYASADRRINKTLEKKPK